jgi:hypothetical protein
MLSTVASRQSKSSERSQTHRSMEYALAGRRAGPHRDEDDAGPAPPRNRRRRAFARRRPSRRTRRQCPRSTKAAGTGAALSFEKGPCWKSGSLLYFLLVVGTTSWRRVHVHTSTRRYISRRCDVSASRIISAVISRVCDGIATGAASYRRVGACPGALRQR